MERDKKEAQHKGILTKHDAMGGKDSEISAFASDWLIR